MTYWRERKKEEGRKEEPLRAVDRSFFLRSPLGQSVDFFLDFFSAFLSISPPVYLRDREKEREEKERRGVKREERRRETTKRTSDEEKRRRKEGRK